MQTYTHISTPGKRRARERTQAAQRAQVEQDYALAEMEARVQVGQPAPPPLPCQTQPGFARLSVGALNMDPEGTRHCIRLASADTSIGL